VGHSLLIVLRVTTARLGDGRREDQSTESESIHWAMPHSTGCLTASRWAARPAKASIALNATPGWPGRLHRVVGPPRSYLSGCSLEGMPGAEL